MEMDEVVEADVVKPNGEEDGTITLIGRFCPLDRRVHLCGLGVQGGVFVTVDRTDGNKDVVVKRFRLIDDNPRDVGIITRKEDQAKNLLREWETLRLCKHPNIVSYVSAFHIEPNFYIVLEKMETNLHEYIQGFKKSVENGESNDNARVDVMAWMAVQLLHAVDYLEQSCIMHRDIKPRNVGFNENGCTLKLLDLGLARIAQNNQEGLSTNRGTPLYQAPEVLFGLPNYGFKVDVWSIFVTLCEVLLIRPLFNNDPEHSVITGSEMKRRVVQICGVPADYKQRLGYGNRSVGNNVPTTSSIRNALPVERLDFELARSIHDNSPNTVEDDFYDLLENVLTFDHQRRYNAKSCLNSRFLRPYDVVYCEKRESPSYRDMLQNEIRRQNISYDPQGRVPAANGV